MKLWLLAVLVVARACTVLSQICQADQPRSECGYLGITQEICESRNCCWTPADSGPWCFNKSAPAPAPPPPSALCNPSGPRIDCGHVGTNQQDCLKKNCCWSPVQNGDPWCFFQRPPTYIVDSIQETPLGVKATLKLNGTTGSKFNRISPVAFELIQETDSRLHIKIYDPSSKRWEVPANFTPIPSPPSQAPSSPAYSYILPKQGKEFNFAIIRKSTMEILFNTSVIGQLQFADQFLSIGTVLPVNPNIYGLGEHKTSLRLTKQTYTLWNFDTPTPQNLNLYGSHPFYLDLRRGGSAHGVFLRNSNGMDVVLSDNSLTYNVIGGILDFYFFLGPTPEAVINQYQAVIGRPHMPPYWALGFHQCRYGYPNVQTLEAVVANYSASKIPLDTMWTDIDYMDAYKDFTLDPKNFPKDEMNKFVEKLHSNGQHYVVIIDPGIKNTQDYQPFTDGMKEDIFIKDKNGSIFIGKVWPGNTAFPDFFNPKAMDYWKAEIDGFLKLLPVDGLWIDMNEISNFCNGACTSSGSPVKPVEVDPNNPPYKINNQGSKAPLNTKTLDMDAVHYGGVLEYDAHNLFGLTEAIATRNALETIRSGVRSFVLSRSTYPGSGTHTGHWTGDNFSKEDDLYYSIPGMLNFQMFGIPLVGSDICGFIGDTSPELCTRWIEVGAFYPFSRNHNTKGAKSQELYRWDSVAEVSRNVLAIRYSLLPYYYTLFFKAATSVEGAATVTRPLFFEFPKDVMTYGIDTQFMVGRCLLVSPVLKLGQTSLDVYFPDARWYDWYTHENIAGGQSKTIATPTDHIQVHIRGGCVIPMQGPALTTSASRQNEFSIMAALDRSGMAVGEVFLDDGESIDIKTFTYVKYRVATRQLTTMVTGTGYASSAPLPPLTKVTIIGVMDTPTKADIDGNTISGFQYDDQTKCLTLTGFSVKMDSKFTLTWS